MPEPTGSDELGDEPGDGLGVGLGDELGVDVLPDVSGIDRAFHYVVPPALVNDVSVGTIVRVSLHGRRVRGYVVAVGVPAPPGVRAQAILQVVSLGPPPPVVELCAWAAWRYAGRLRPLLLAASPARMVRSLPPPLVRRQALSLEGPGPARRAGSPEVPSPPWLAAAVSRALGAREAVLRLPPAIERLPVVLGVLGATRQAPGDPMVLVESQSDAGALARRLVALGLPACLYPEQWPGAAAGGCVVIGTRNVAFAPGKRSVILVLDAFSEAYRSERAPTFDARVVVAERGRAEGAAVVFVSSCPSAELLDTRTLVTVDPSTERNGWPTTIVLDAREEDPREGGYPSRLVSLVRAEVAAGGGPEPRVVLVLNRAGRARLLACGVCRTIQRCSACGAALVQPVRPPRGTIGVLLCPSCRDSSPALCTACGSARLRILRPGVALAREQLESLLGVEVAEMGVPGSPAPRAPVVIGTEAVLHAVRRAAMVGFLDLDHELLAPRFRASEEALALLARASRLVGGRLVGGRQGHGRLVVRTSVPDHEVVRAVQAGAPQLVTEVELERRSQLRLPPVTALAEVTGAAARRVVDQLEGVEVAPVRSGRYLVRANSSEELADAFARLVAGAPAGWAGVDARVEVDPLGI